MRTEGNAKTSKFTLAQVLEVLAALGPPTAVFVAVVAHFGWASTARLSTLIGIDVDLLGYSTQDYFLLALSTFYMPALIGSAVAIVWVWVDGWIRGSNHSERVNAIIFRVSVCVCLAYWLSSFLVLSNSDWIMWGPYVVAAGVLITAWFLRIKRHVRPSRKKRLTIGERAVGIVAVTSFVALLLFWGTNNYLEMIAWERFHNMQLVTSMPNAQVYSMERLYISGSGVEERAIGTAENPMYQYDGLRLLRANGERFLLLADHWNIRDGKVIVLHDTDSIRVEYGR